MTFSPSDEKYMRRALQLATNGYTHVSPNPMVGAVVVAPDGLIIGEGWHRRFGGPHAEVNALATIPQSCNHLLPQSTMYVTLEPCSHYGKTPPCAKLLVETGLKRIVIAAGDPNPKVSGRGIEMLRSAGIEVEKGLLERQSRWLNKAFITAQTLHRPYITLKWAMSTDGFMDIERTSGQAAARFSTSAGAMKCHIRRAANDAIVVGASTVLADNPTLTTRHIAGPSPRPVVLDRHSIAVDTPLVRRAETLHFTDNIELSELARQLFKNEGITSMLVEGGASVLKQFIDLNLWDEIYVEISPVKLAGKGRVKAPTVPAEPVDSSAAGENLIFHYLNINTAQMLDNIL